CATYGYDGYWYFDVW
nr:immunoglobulin heavy chain junction region [Mus musculus]MBK4196534.1 immunoglobulin heavy chain junction region [Mus musculus]MBK4196536.1 immunoglobulin heavy chain junction region [Mus musculus]MBK4196543.1 immunoglobulin heavy chain junction region [Mus musculus]